MSIASRISAMQEHLRDDYDVLNLAGADLTNVNKNILNLKSTWQERLLYFMNNGTDVVWNNWDKVIGEGTTLTLNNTLEGKMKIDLKGNTSQEGTPTPETPQDIHVVSGNNTIDIHKNFFDGEIEQGSFRVEDGTTYPSEIRVRSTNYINVDEGTYVFDLKNNSNYYIVVYVYDENNNYISSESSINWNALPFTKSFSNKRKIKFGIRYASNRVITPADVEQIIVNSSNYLRQYPINLGDIELCKIGDYQDRIVKDNGKWYLKKEIGKLDNDIVIISYNSTYRYYTITPNITGAGAKTYSSTLSTHFQKTGPLRIVGSNSTNLWLWDENNYFQNATEIKQFMINNNVKTYYILNTPTYTEITDSTLLSQLNALAKSYEGQTNISQESNDLASILNATALEEM